LAELASATATVELRLAQMAGCKYPDYGHLKSLRQALNRLEEAYQKVNDHCGNFPGSGLVLAAAALAIAAADAALVGA
jgi:hypothetical protein